MKTVFVRFAALAITIVTLASCDSSSIVEPQQALRDAQLRWNQRSPDSYTVVVNRACGECLPGASGQVTVKVVNHQVVSRTYVSNGQTVPENLAGAFPTVEEFFDLIVLVLGTDPYKAEIEYDADLGYPKSLSVDYSQQAVDDEFFVGMSDFKPNQ